MIRALDEHRPSDLKRSHDHKSRTPALPKTAFQGQTEEDIYGSAQVGFGLRHDTSEGSPEKLLIAAQGRSKADLRQIVELESEGMYSPKRSVSPERSKGRLSRANCKTASAEPKYHLIVREDDRFLEPTAIPDKEYKSVHTRAFEK